VSVWAQSAESVSGGVLVLTMEMTLAGPPTSVIHVYRYVSGDLSEVWSTSVEGWAWAYSFDDVDADRYPEIVVMKSALSGVGVGALLVYGNRSGTYELVFNETGKTQNGARAHVIDYYDNGTLYLLTSLDGSLCLIGYVSDQLLIRERLPYLTQSDMPISIDVGDTDDNGIADIVYRSPGGVVVLENQGKGVYSRYGLVEEGEQLKPAEIRVGDVDGDGLDEIVMVGWLGGPSLSVWKRLKEGYRSVWTYGGRGMGSVDIGDLDGDGLNEIVTSTEGRQDEPGAWGPSVWEYQPEIVYEGRTLQSGGFRRVWEDDVEYLEVGRDVSLRIGPVDPNGQEQIFAIARFPSDLDAYHLYIACRGEDGYDSKTILLWDGSSQMCPLLDIWPLDAAVDECILVALPILTACTVCSILTREYWLRRLS